MLHLCYTPTKQGYITLQQYYTENLRPHLLMLLSTRLSFPLLSLSPSICLQSSSFLLHEVIAMFDQSA